MPTTVALPRYSAAVAWSKQIPGVFTIGYSRLNGPDTLGQPHPQYGFNQPYDDVSENLLSFEYTRGRSDDLTEVNAGSGSLTVIDEAEVYNPHNKESPVADDLKPLRPFRVTAVGPRLVAMTANGWQVDDVVRARAIQGNSFGGALLKKRPLAYWRFDEAQGSGEHFDAGGDADLLAYPSKLSALTDTASLIAGDPGTAKQFASDGYVTVNHVDSVNPRGAVTVVALFRPTLTGLGPWYLLHKPGQWSLRIDKARKLNFSYLGNDGVGIYLATIPALTSGTQYLAVVAWDGKDIQIWLNGVEVEVGRGEVENP